MTDSSPTDGKNPSRTAEKYYSITPLGLEFLGQLQASWDEISNSVNSSSQTLLL